MAIFGGSYTAGKLAVQDLPVFGMLAVRMAITAAVLAAYAAWAGLALAPRGSGGYLAAQVGCFLVSQSLLFVGLTMTSAGRAAILFNMQPFFTLLLLPLFVASDRLTARRWLGTGAAFAGVALVLAERGLQGGSLPGDVLALVAALGWTGGIILNRRMPRHLNPVAVIFWSAAGSIPVFAALALLLERDQAWNLSAAAVGSVLYLAVLAAGVGFVLAVWLMRTYSPSRVNVFVFLSPVFGVLIGWALLGEPVSLQQALGAAGVAAGILIVTAER